MCKRCGKSHKPPTGKRCQFYEEPQEATREEEMSPAMQRMEKRMEEQMEKFDIMMRRLEVAGADRQSVTSQVESDTDGVAEAEQSEQDVLQLLTPTSLRKDVRAMQKAAQRMVEIQEEEEEETEEINGARGRRAGKKSGCLLVAAHNVKERIDWPHMHIQRVAGGRRLTVTYEELRIEEFVYGFLEMLKVQRDRWNKDLMLDILQMLMQDTMDFAWENARNFYKMIGVDVESGARRWEDTEIIRDMRLLHSRTVYPEKREPKENKKANPTKSTPQNLRCCAPYQRKTCEQNRDHPPFTHACSYCAKATGVAYRHPEDDCFRKSIDESKNSAKRE